MGERKAGDWIQGFRYFTGESEAPDSYIFWTAMTTLSGALRRRVYVPWIYYKFYPNIYTVLVGPPGKVHKSSVIHFARQFLRELKIPIASEAVTKEGLIEQMVARAGKVQVGKELHTVSALAVISSELMTFVAPSSERMIEFLTDIFDTPDEWEYTTKGSGTKLIERPYLSLLAGTTPSWIANSFDITFVEQGLASRTLFVFENKPRFHRAFSNITTDMWDMRDRLVEDLKQIAKLQGEFTWTDDGREWFRHWYEEELPQEKLDYRLSGYLARKPTHVLKVAMLLSVSESDSMLLDERYLRTAKAALDALEPSMARTFSAVGRNPYASDLERIWSDIVFEGGMTKGEIVERNYHAMGRQAIDEQLENLTLMGVIRMTTNGSTIYYEPVEDAKHGDH